MEKLALAKIIDHYDMVQHAVDDNLHAACLRTTGFGQEM